MPPAACTSDPSKNPNATHSPKLIDALTGVISLSIFASNPELEPLVAKYDITWLR